MDSKQRKLVTCELLRHLEQSASFDNAMETCIISVDNPKLNYYILSLFNIYNYTPAMVIQKANLSKSFTYQILNGMRVPKRDILIRIALAIGLDLNETQKLLTIGQRGILYPRVRRDAAVIFCLNKHYTLEETNDLLEEVNEMPLLEGENDGRVKG